ncbi:hypothetical protein [Streptomyces sp. NPDC017993]|uniref:hypothetical protein n=1 Tax=Streptomyces sp. NPDC017993 TaxID=3365027 RepID=UPI00379BFF36
MAAALPNWTLPLAISPRGTPRLASRITSSWENFLRTYAWGYRMPSEFPRERLAAAVAESSHWADLMRRLNVKASGGRRRSLQASVAEFGIDTRHFKQRSA